MEKRSIRIIPRLDVKGPNLVKGVQMEGLRVLGPPDFYAERYYLDGADELWLSVPSGAKRNCRFAVV